MPIIHRCAVWRLTVAQVSDFGFQFARYLAQEMHSPNAFGASLGDSPEASDDEDDGGWLTNSQFNLEREPPASTRERRPLSATGFDVSLTD